MITLLQSPQKKDNTHTHRAAMVFLLLLALSLCLCMVIAPPGTRAVNASHSHSHSHSHSRSHSHSMSQGVCAVAGVTGVQPSGPHYRDLAFRPCNDTIANVDNTYGAHSVYPCIFPGGPVLTPTEVSLQLSTGGANSHGTDYISVYISYNYTHFHSKHPKSVSSCYTEPTPGPHNPPFLDWIYYGSYAAGCNRICTIEARYRVQCGADYMRANSGKYYIEIPNVGRVNFNVSICISEKFATDYASECEADMHTCPQDTANSLGSFAPTLVPKLATLLFTTLLAVLLF